jgi:hypothetical protein
VIPQQLLSDYRNVDNLRQWLVESLTRTRSERAPLEQDWIRFAQLYDAQPALREQTFPFKGAANVVIPVAATDVDTTVAALMGSIYASPNIWSSEARRPDWIEYAARVQEFMEAVQETELKMYPTVLEWVTEITKLGTGILKRRYVKENRKVWEFREQGPGQPLAQMVRRLVANRPEIKRVALPDFYIPATASGIGAAPWTAERLQLSWHALESRVRAGIYLPDALDRIGFHWRQSQPRTAFGQYQYAQEALDRFIPSFGDLFEIFEFWTDYDIDRDGEPEALVCTLHLPSNTYLRIDYNPFFSQEKPYDAARFLVQEGRFYGIGLCKMLEMFQEEITVMHRQRIDSGTVRNAAVFKGRKGASLPTDLQVWPGRVIMMDNPESDLLPMPMGLGVESTINDEQFILEYAHQRSSISDYQRGGAGTPAISYSTATTTVEMLRQGRLRLDQVLREINSALGNMGQGALELYQQFDQQGKPFLLMGPQDGQIVQAVLQFPMDLIRNGISIKVTATNAQLNKETQIRTTQIVFGLVMQFYQQVLQAMQIAFNPMLPLQMQQAALHMIIGGATLARRTLDIYEIQDRDQIIPDIGGLLAQPQQQPGLGPPPGYGGAPMGPGPGFAPGMAALPPGPGAAYGPGAQPGPGLGGLAAAFSAPG